MDDNSMSFLRELLQPELLQFILIGACTVLWFVFQRAVAKFDKISDKFEGIEQRLDAKVDSLREDIVEQRREFHASLQELVRREMCSAHRAEIMRRIDAIQDIRGIAFTKHGVGFVNINDEGQMHDLYERMTPEERAAHYDHCQFRGQEK